MIDMAKVDRNRMVGDLMKGVPRTGFKYLDLKSGILLNDLPEKKKEEKPDAEKPKPEEKDENLDLNKDGKFDDADKSIAGKVLATKKKKK